MFRILQPPILLPTIPPILPPALSILPQACDITIQVAPKTAFACASCLTGPVQYRVRIERMCHVRPELGAPVFRPRSVLHPAFFGLVPWPTPVAGGEKELLSIYLCKVVEEYSSRVFFKDSSKRHLVHERILRFWSLNGRVATRLKCNYGLAPD